jgi:hypothetical protein
MKNHCKVRNLIFLVFLAYASNNFLIAQDSQRKLLLDSLIIQPFEWECIGLKLDTMLNPNFHPNPIFIKGNNKKAADDTIYKLSIYLEELNFLDQENKIRIKGKLIEGDYGGWGTEVFIMTATRIDTVIEYYAGHDSHPILHDTIKCLELRNLDYSYTNCYFLPRKEVEFDCILNIKQDNDVLVFAKNRYYAEIFDLKKIKKYFMTRYIERK